MGERVDEARADHLRYKAIDVLHGLRCRGVVLHAADGILCLLCGKEWDCPCAPAPSTEEPTP